MECLVRILLLWATVLSWTKVNGQFSGRTREVFFVNLEEGFFGCQVNETADVLQIFKIKKMCDGVSDCFRGSDENSKDLKCSSKWNINDKENISTKYHIETLVSHDVLCIGSWCVACNNHWSYSPKLTNFNFVQRKSSRNSKRELQLHCIHKTAFGAAAI